MATFEFYRRGISGSAVAPLWGVEHFDVVEDIGLGGIARRINLATDAFALEQLKEALGHGVIVAIAAPTHAIQDTEFGLPRANGIRESRLRCGVRSRLAVRLRPARTLRDAEVVRSAWSTTNRITAATDTGKHSGVRRWLQTSPPSSAWRCTSIIPSPQGERDLSMQVLMKGQSAVSRPLLFNIRHIASYKSAPGFTSPSIGELTFKEGREWHGPAPSTARRTAGRRVHRSGRTRLLPFLLGHPVSEERRLRVAA